MPRLARTGVVVRDDALALSEARRRQALTPKAPVVAGVFLFRAPENFRQAQPRMQQKTSESLSVTNGSHQPIETTVFPTAGLCEPCKCAPQSLPDLSSVTYLPLLLNHTLDFQAD